MGIMDFLKGAGNFMTTPFDANRMNLGQMNPLQSLAGIAALAALAKKHPGTSAVLLGGTLGLNKRARQQREMDKINRILGLPSGTTNPLEQVEAQKFADQQLSQDMFSKMYGASQKGYTPSPWGIGKLKGNDLVNFINMNTPTAKISGNFLETQPGKFGKDRTPAIKLLPETSLQRSQILRNLASANNSSENLGIRTASPGSSILDKSGKIIGQVPAKPETLIPAKPETLKKPPLFYQKKINDLNTTLKKLDNMEKLAKPEYLGWFDTVQGKIGEETGNISSDEIMFRQKVKSFEDDILRLRSGAAISANEFERIQKFVMNLRQSHKTFKAKLNSIRDEINSIKETTIADLEMQGYGFKNNETESVEDIQRQLDEIEEKIRKAGGE